MEEKKKFDLFSLKDKAVSHLASFDKDDVIEKVQKAGEALGDKAMELKDSALAKKEDITDKLTELDRMLESSESFRRMNGPMK